jgi:hypothetical protein
MTEQGSQIGFLKKLASGFRDGRLGSLFPYIAIAVVTIGVSLWMQWDTADMFPNGDAYIHLAYARNLADSGQLNYNPGLREGVGSTSVLWVFVLALIHRLTDTPILWTRMLGIVLLTLDAFLIYDISWLLLKKHTVDPKRIYAVAVALLATISGTLVWMAQSGMETIFWVTLVLMALKAYQAQRRVLLGVFLGLFALTRIEGVLLAGAVLLVDLLHHRRITKDMLKTAIPVAALVLPWLVYLQMREGSPTTSSYVARNFYMQGINERIAAEFPLLEWAFKIPPIFYTLQWFGFLSFYATGLVSLSGPLLDVKITEIGTTVEVSLIGVLMGAAITLVAIVIALRAIWMRRQLFSLDHTEGRLLLILGGWLAAHNLVFAILMPRIGGAGRYVPFNIMLYWVFLGLAVYALLKGRARYVGVACMVVLTAVSLMYWKLVYQAHVLSMTSVRQAGALYIDEHLPADEPIGGIDIGIQRYYARQQFVDLAGHVNNDVLTYWQEEGGVAGFVVERRLCHIALQGPVDGTGLDMRHAMGLDSDERFELVQEAIFSTTLEEWQQGLGPMIYMPSAIVYRVEWRDPTICDGVILETGGP